MAINIQVMLGLSSSVCTVYDVLLQLAILASATVHVIAHGGMSYALMFASAFIIVCIAFDWTSFDLHLDARYLHS
jgi:hypothetical protein